MTRVTMTRGRGCCHMTRGRGCCHKGMVATSQPLAAQAGLEILKKGGNAIDAAIATAACLTVVEPTSNGLGSDAFAIVYTNNKLHRLNASGYVIPETGIALQNRLHNFNYVNQSNNCLMPHKKTYHTIIPGFLMKDGEAVGPFGVMGGFMQPQGHVQVVTNLIDFHIYAAVPKKELMVI